MKIITSILVVLMLTACNAKPLKVLPSDRYLVDLEVGLMCRHMDCYDLSLIIPSFHEMRVIKAYELDASILSWSEEALVEILLNPPGNQYQVTQLSEVEFDLPANPQTDVIYDLLRDEFNLLYARTGDRIVDITNSVKGLKMNDGSIEQPIH